MIYSEIGIKWGVIVIDCLSYSWSDWWAGISVQDTNPFLEHSIGAHCQHKFFC